MKKIRMPAMLAATAALLAGCGGGGWWPWGGSPGAEIPRIPRDASVYACDGGKRLLVRYAGDRKSAMIVFPEREFRLDNAASESGAKYSNAHTTLSTKGDEAMLEEEGKTTFANCRLAPAS